MWCVIGGGVWIREVIVFGGKNIRLEIVRLDFSFVMLLI